MDLSGQGIEAARGSSWSNRLESEAQSSSSFAIEEANGDLVMDSGLGSYLLGINDLNQNTVDVVLNGDQDEAGFGVGSETIRRNPASRTVVQNLPSVVLNLSEEDALCSICMDRIRVGEEAKQLPCGHGFHGECIRPWLEITDTCPLCRHELPKQC